MVATLKIGIFLKHFSLNTNFYTRRIVERQSHLSDRIDLTELTKLITEQVLL